MLLSGILLSLFVLCASLSGAEADKNAARANNCRLEFEIRTAWTAAQCPCIIFRARANLAEPINCTIQDFNLEKTRV